MRNDRDATPEVEGEASAPAAVTAALLGDDPSAGGAGAPVATLELQAREQFLSQVSDVLNSSLDYRATIQSVARLCAGFIAEYCIVHVEDAGEIRALGIAHTDVDREQGLREILRLLPIGPSSRNPVVEVLRSGQSRLMEHIGDSELAALTGSSPYGGRLRELGLTSALMVPLTARGHTLGAISLARSGNAPPYGEADVATVEELARRAALPVDNARLYREARREAKARERTLGVVSHDLRNALNSALMHSDLLLDLSPEQLTGPPGRKQMMGLRRSLEHMQRLVQDLLDVENIESGRLSLHLAPLDLRALAGEIDEMFAPLARERGVEFYVELPAIADGPPADHVRIVQVLTNLVTNALEFTPAGGTIAVTATEDGGVLRFCVQDNGAGIAAADLPHVFDRHWRGESSTRRAPGSGLGLTIVRGLVQAHGGETWLHSVQGAGSSFYFTLPVVS
jgi:signal transduction histidine kinase